MFLFVYIHLGNEKQIELGSKQLNRDEKSEVSQMSHLLFVSCIDILNIHFILNPKQKNNINEI